MTFTTDLGSPGTQVANLASGVVNWISGAGLDYQVEKLDYPTFWAVAGQVERSRGVILLLGFYEENGGVYKRLGGHYVTAAGVDQQGGFIALSDPWFDRIEATWPYAGLAEAPDTPVYFGRRDDGLVLHHVAHDQAEPDLIHNDAGNISHDIYRVTTVSGTAGFWGPEKYATTWEQVANFLNQNGSGNTFSGGNLVTLVEAAVVIWQTPRTTYIPIILK